MAEPQTAHKATSDAEVALHDTHGGDLGTTIKVGPPADDADGDPTSVEALAARVTGWTKLVIDGEAYTFSKGRALALLNRFPHFAAQIRSALNESA